MMEENSPHIVQMPVQSEKTSSRLIGPNFYLVIIPTRNEERLCFMEVNASNRPVMLFKSIDKGTHSIVPQLYGR